MTDRGAYHLGLPAWAFPGWQGRYFEALPSPLASYARVFGAVEGNTTFYRVPSPEMVARWRDAVADRAFRFCFKLPRSVTHERRPDAADLEALLSVLAPLKGHLGPLLLQFPATVGPEQIGRFESVIGAVRERHEAVLEVRHPAFFDDPGLLEPVLERFELGRVVLDCRPLYGGDPEHPEVRDALHEKPDLPVRPEVREGVGFVRLVLHPDSAGNRPALEDWAERVAAWLAEGQAVYVMIHCPNNLHCPAFAESFHDLLRRRMPGLAPLPPWPVPQQNALI